MATICRDFDGYRLWYISNDDLFAVVHCYKGSAFMGRISFFKEGKTIPANSTLPNGPSIHFSASRFNDVMTILKQERPLYLFLNLDTLEGMVANNQYEWMAGKEMEERS